MFTLAHISDIHLAPVPTPRFGDLDAKRALGLVNWHRKRKLQHRRDVLDGLMSDLAMRNPDHIAVGGDLVNVGLPAELEAAQLWLKGLGPPDHVSVVPGNHDVYGKFGEDAGIARWQANMSGERASSAEPFPFVRRFGQVALICLSSAVPTPVFWASGRLGSPQREALASLLGELGDSKHCRIVLLHHPPLPGQADRRRGLEDASELQTILRDRGAELVLHGHNHQATLKWTETRYGRIPVAGVPSASASPGTHVPPARYNLFTIEQQNSGWRIGLVGRGYQPGGAIGEVERQWLAG